MRMNMSWGERFALMDHFAPTDEQVCSTFGLSSDELETARTLRQSGMITATSSKLDMEKYAGVFVTGGSLISPDNSSGSRRGNATSYMRPESASRKPKSPPAKRGSKGVKISTAFRAVPTIQVPVDAFIAEHGVSLAVLRQSKRFIATFDPSIQALIGKINVRQDKTTKQLMIWREHA